MMTEQEKRRMAELEAANARAGQNAAEMERDVVADVAVNESLHRAVAEDVAANARMRAVEAEARERSANTSAAVARQSASTERAAASNAMFSATMFAVMAGAIVLAAVIYFAWWRPNNAVPQSSTVIRTEKTTVVPGAPAPSSTVIVQPPAVNVKVTNPTPEEKPAEAAPPEVIRPDADNPASPETPAPAPSGGGTAPAPEGPTAGGP